MKIAIETSTQRGCRTAPPATVVRTTVAGGAVLERGGEDCITRMKSQGYQKESHRHLRRMRMRMTMRMRMNMRMKMPKRKSDWNRKGTKREATSNQKESRSNQEGTKRQPREI